MTLNIKYFKGIFSGHWDGTDRRLILILMDETEDEEDS